MELVAETAACGPHCYWAVCWETALMVEVGIILAEVLPDLEEEAVVVDSEEVLVVLVAVVLAVVVPEVVGNLSTDNLLVP